jgi:putative transposase
VRTAVSEITERLWAQYEAFASRDLSDFEVVYLFVDDIAERLHLGQPREAVLAAWGVLADGHKVLLHLAPGSKEDTARCHEFFQDMRQRGLGGPLLVVSDGAPGLIRAIEECFRCASAASCTSCATYRAKCPRTIGQSSRRAPSLVIRPPALARPLRDLVATYGAALPSALACLEDNFEACIAHLRFPLAHRRAIRTTNRLERLFGEERVWRARCAQPDVCRADPRGQTLARLAHDRIRMPAAKCSSQRGRSRSRRTNHRS